jgi:hypothetical protein
VLDGFADDFQLSNDSILLHPIVHEGIATDRCVVLDVMDRICGCDRGRSGRPSQGAGFGQNPFAQRGVHAGIRQDVDLAVKQIFEILTKGHEIEQ